MYTEDRGDLLKLLIASILGLGFIVMSSWANYSSVRDDIVAKEQRQLLTIAESISSNLESVFEYRRNSIRQLRYNELFIDEFNAYLKTGNPSGFKSLENYYAIMQENVSRVSLEDVNFHTVASYPVEGGIRHPVDKSGVLKAISSGDTVVSPVYRFDDGLFINILEPVTIDKETKAVIVFEISLERLYLELVAPAKVGTKGYASVKDRDGILIMHPKVEDLGMEVIEARQGEFPEYDWSELEALVEKQKLGESGVGTYHSVWYQDENPERIKKVNAYAPAWISDTFWIVNVSADYMELTAFIQQKLYMMLISSAGVILIFIGSMLYIYKIKKDKERLQIEAGLSIKLNELNEELEKDIEKRIVLEGSLRQHIEKYERLFEGTSDAIFVFSLESDIPVMIEELNEKACLLLGRPYEELVGKPMPLSVILEGADRLLRYLKGEEACEAGFFEDKLITRTEKRIPVEVSPHRIHYLNDWKLILLCRDISLRKSQEESLKRSELRFRQIVSQVADQITLEHEDGDSVPAAGTDLEGNSLAQSLERINIQLEELFRKEMDENQKTGALLLHQSRLAAMGEMIANIAHQWRQPLSGLGLIVENLKDAYDFDDLTKPYFEEQVDKTRRLIRQMNRTIDDFRDFFNPTSQEESFVLEDSLRACVNFVEGQLKLSGITMNMSMEEGLAVYGHQNRFSQVILSLIQNAIDALAGEDRDVKQIWIESEREENRIRVRITDTGEGIPQAVIDRIFEPYFSTKGKQNGTGLGLYLSKTIIEKNFGGDITASNTAKGACFTVVLPVREGRSHE